MKVEALQISSWSKDSVRKVIKHYEDQMRRIPLKEGNPLTRIHEQMGLSGEARHFVCK